MKILIVDDDASSRRLLRLVVESHGHSVIEASDGQEGLEKAREHKPAAIISDAVMPKMDGFSFLHVLRHDDALGNIPFILFTAIYTRDDEYKLARSLGADALIVKPIAPDAFWEEFTAALQKHAASKELAVRAPLDEKEEELFRDYCRLVAAKLEEKVRELKATIAEHERTKTILTESEQRYRNLVESAQDVIFVLGSDGTIASLNPIFETITGWSRTESIGRNFTEFVHPDDLSVAKDRFLHVMRGESQPLYVLRILHKSGSYLYGEFISRPNLQEGNIVGLSGVARDITERKQREDMIRNIALQQKAILSNIPDIAWLKDEESRFIAVNEPFGKACGVKPEDLVGKTDLDIWPKDLAERYRADDRAVMESGKRKIVDEPLANKEGKTVWIETVKTPIYDEKGTVIGTTGIARDVTERKHAEEVLKESENKFRNLTERTLVGTYIFQDNVFKYVNPRFIEIFGYSAEELIDRLGPLDLTLPEDQALVEKNIRKRQSGEVESVHYEFRGVRRDGQIIYLELLGSNIMYEGRRAVIGTLLDITERKLAEEQLYMAKHDWEETFNTITDMVTVHDKDFNIIRANKAAEKILGLPFLEVKKVKCFEYYHDTGCPPDGCPSCQSLVTGKPSVFELFEPHLKMYIEIQAIPRLDSNNQVVGLIHIVRDISERKKAEDLLKEAKNKAQKYLDVAGVMIVALDSEGRITLINKKGLEMLGYEEHEVINQNWFDLCCIPGHVREEVKGVFNKLMAGDIKAAEHYENAIITKGKVERILAFRNAILKNESGEISGILFSGEDISERKKSEEALKIYSRELTSLNMASDTLMLITNLRDIYQEICDIIYTVFDLRMVWLGIIEEGSFQVKPVAYTGYEEGYLSSIKVTWDDSPTGMGPIGMAIKTRRPTKVNINEPSFAVWKTEAQERVFRDIVSVPLVYARDKCLGALNFYSDNSDYFTPDRIKLCQIFANQAAIAIENASLIEELESKVIERTKEFEDANRELQTVNRELFLRREEADAASRSKTDFLANMSHELRTPLNAILGFSEILQQGMAGPITDKQKEFLGDISTSGSDLLSLITDILDLSKIEAGKFDLQLETFIVEDIIKSSLVMFKEKALKHKIKLSSDIDNALTGITADQRKLKQIIVNLLSNAFKFTPDGGSVWVNARKVVRDQSSGIEKAGISEKGPIPKPQQPTPDGDFLEISVSDTGIGISKENQQRLFQPFQQIETSLTRKYSGTGLGLSLCRRLIELHGGRIWVESEPGKGSRFVFVIPMNQ